MDASHLVDPKKKGALEKYLKEGGDPRWIKGNKEADKCAERGTRLMAPPERLVLRERFRLLVTRTVQRMMAHIWAAHCGYIEIAAQDAREAEMDDKDFGLPDPWEQEWDPFEQVFTEQEI